MMTNAERLKTATRQTTLIAAAFEAGRMMRHAGKTLGGTYPLRWRASLRRAYGDGYDFADSPSGSAPASWVRRSSTPPTPR